VFDPVSAHADLSPPQASSTNGITEDHHLLPAPPRCIDALGALAGPGVRWVDLDGDRSRPPEQRSHCIAYACSRILCVSFFTLSIASEEQLP
jgi:hypothetical protein